MEFLNKNRGQRIEDSGLKMKICNLKYRGAMGLILNPEICL